MGRPFYAAEDPFCEERAPDDKQWGVDHLYRKLLRIQDGLRTATARAIAAERTAFMESYLRQLAAELGVERG